MKIGDKLICKKSISEIEDGLTLNKKYVINDIFDDYIVVKNDYNTNTFLKTDKYNYWYIWDYFYNPDEIRIKKLKSI